MYVCVCVCDETPTFYLSVCTAAAAAAAATSAHGNAVSVFIRRLEPARMHASSCLRVKGKLFLSLSRLFSYLKSHGQYSCNLLSADDMY